MGDNLVNLSVQAIGDVQTFINQTIPLFQEHLDEGVHTVEHLQDIINHLIVINQDTANPQDWPLDQNSSSDSGGPASSNTTRTEG